MPAMLGHGEPCQWMAHIQRRGRKRAFLPRSRRERERESHRGHSEFSGLPQRRSCIPPPKAGHATSKQFHFCDMIHKSANCSLWCHGREIESYLSFHFRASMMHSDLQQTFSERYSLSSKKTSCKTQACIFTPIKIQNMLGEKTKLYTIRAVQSLTATDVDQLFCNRMLAWLFIFRGRSVAAAVQTLTIIILLCVESGEMGLTLSNERDWQPSECLISMIGFSFGLWQVHKKANSIWTTFIAFTELLWVLFYGGRHREILYKCIQINKSFMKRFMSTKITLTHKKIWKATFGKIKNEKIAAHEPVFNHSSTWGRFEVFGQQIHNIAMAKCQNVNVSLVGNVNVLLVGLICWGISLPVSTWMLIAKYIIYWHWGWMMECVPGGGQVHYLIMCIEDSLVHKINWAARSLSIQT